MHTVLHDTLQIMSKNLDWKTCIKAAQIYDRRSSRLSYLHLQQLSPELT